MTPIDVGIGDQLVERGARRRDVAARVAHDQHVGLRAEARA